MEELYVVEFSKKKSKVLPMNPDMFYDPYYRYKVIQIEIEYKNGFTFILDYKKFINSCKTEKETFIKFLKKKSCSNCNIYNNDIRISTKIDKEELSEYIKIFLKTFILCKKCEMPELNKGVCNACGYS